MRAFNGIINVSLDKLKHTAVTRTIHKSLFLWRISAPTLIYWATQIPITQHNIYILIAIMAPALSLSLALSLSFSHTHIYIIEFLCRFLIFTLNCYSAPLCQLSFNRIILVDNHFFDLYVPGDMVYLIFPIFLSSQNIQSYGCHSLPVQWMASSTWGTGQVSRCLNVSFWRL